LEELRLARWLAEEESVAEADTVALAGKEPVALPVIVPVCFAAADAVIAPLVVRDTDMEREGLPDTVGVLLSRIVRVPVVELVDVRDCVVEGDKDLEPPTDTDTLDVAVALLVPLVLTEPDAVLVGVREIRAEAVLGPDAVEVLEEETLPVLVRVMGFVPLPLGDRELLVEPVLVRLPMAERVPLGLALEVRLGTGLLESVGVLVVVFEVETEAVEVRVVVDVLVELELPVEVRVEVIEFVVAEVALEVFDTGGVRVASTVGPGVVEGRDVRLGGKLCTGLLVIVLERVEVLEAVAVVDGRIPSSIRASIEIISGLSAQGDVATFTNDSKSRANFIPLL